MGAALAVAPDSVSRSSLSPSDDDCVVTGVDSPPGADPSVHVRSTWFTPGAAATPTGVAGHAIVRREAADGVRDAAGRAERDTEGDGLALSLGVTEVDGCGLGDAVGDSVSIAELLGEGLATSLVSTDADGDGESPTIGASVASGLTVSVAITSAPMDIHGSTDVSDAASSDGDAGGTSAGALSAGALSASDGSTLGSGVSDSDGLAGVGSDSDSGALVDDGDGDDSVAEGDRLGDGDGTADASQTGGRSAAPASFAELAPGWPTATRAPRDETSRRPAPSARPPRECLRAVIIATVSHLYMHSEPNVRLSHSPNGRNVRLSQLSPAQSERARSVDACPRVARS